MRNRRQIISIFANGMVGTICGMRSSWAFGEMDKAFVAEAFRMKREAEGRGDQPFGAVIVRAGTIIGYGPSRVVADRNPAAHAERVALWDAQRRAGSSDLAGAVIYSTSRPCSACENALALSNIARMLFGAAATDAGRPQRQ